MQPFSYTGMKIIHDEKIQEALESHRLYAEQKQGLLHTLGEFLARLTNQSGQKIDTEEHARW